MTDDIRHTLCHKSGNLLIWCFNRLRIQTLPIILRIVVFVEKMKRQRSWCKKKTKKKVNLVVHTKMTSKYAHFGPFYKNFYGAITTWVTNIPGWGSGRGRKRWRGGYNTIRRLSLDKAQAWISSSPNDGEEDESIIFGRHFLSPGKRAKYGQLWADWIVPDWSVFGRSAASFNQKKKNGKKQCVFCSKNTHEFNKKNENQIGHV